ncbi:TRAP transporter substrate-binding protein [Fodinicurvata sp. EGI_FJ10296]|uniref:TRAP transporter substrate-binding protein n=1 Tax=Fodinicurvata sp. EGI_FJ10296 TaxID=3231908 RepID=UPI003454F8B1
MTIKRQGLLRSAALPVLGAALLMAAPAQADSGLDEREFNVVGSWSTSNLYPDYEEPFWTETLPEASDGRLTATVSAFDELGLAGGEVYELVQQGVYDSGATVIEYVAGEDPRFEGHDLPAIADPAVSRELVDAYRDTLAQAFDEVYDARLVGIVPFTSQVVYCNTEISGLQDLEGLQIRGSGPMTMGFIEAVGGSAQAVSFNEVPIALERGVIDCGITGALSGYLAGWTEVATHFYPLPTGGWDHIGIVFSNQTWDGLNEETQSFLLDEFAALEDLVWGDATAMTQAGIACNTGGDCPAGEAHDLTLVEVTDEDLAYAAELVQETVLPAWFERCGEECATQWQNTVGEVYSAQYD